MAVVVLVVVGPLNNLLLRLLLRLRRLLRRLLALRLLLRLSLLRLLLLGLWLLLLLLLSHVVQRELKLCGLKLHSAIESQTKNLKRDLEMFSLIFLSCK